MRAIQALREVLPECGQSGTLTAEEFQDLWDAAQADADEIKSLLEAAK